MPSPSHIVCPQCGTVNRVPAERPAAAARCGGCHATLFAAHPVEVDQAAFERHLRDNDIPVLVDIWAPWCGPCRAMAPQFERAAAALEPQVRLLKLNADTAPDTCERLGVRGIPAMYLFRNGDVLARTEGAMNADAIVRWVRDGLTTHQHWQETVPMTIDRAVLAFAGIIVLLSAALVWLVSPWWLLLTGFVGLNMIQSSLTGFCPAVMVFKALGAKPGCAFS